MCIMQLNCGGDNVSVLAQYKKVNEIGMLEKAHLCQIDPNKISTNLIVQPKTV